VVRLDAGRRQVVVGPREALARSEIRVGNVNWLGDEAVGGEGLAVRVRLRSSQALRPATVYPAESGLRVLLAAPEFGVAPGQACVAYDAVDGERVLGGGTILRDAPAAGSREA
jgi:tRNA-specific 2-thiouridylase